MGACSWGAHPHLGDGYWRRRDGKGSAGRTFVLCVWLCSCLWVSFGKLTWSCIRRGGDYCERKEKEGEVFLKRGPSWWMMMEMRTPGCSAYVIGKRFPKYMIPPTVAKGTTRPAKAHEILGMHIDLFSDLIVFQNITSFTDLANYIM
jgi:hypothetical protein